MKLTFSLCTLLIGAMCAAAQPPATMKAIVVHEFGGPDMLRYEDAPRPEPKENEILIRVFAAGVNPVDAGVRSGKYGGAFGAKATPFIPGYDVAGIVEKTGTSEAASKYKKGDAVYAFLSIDRGGGYAEFAIALPNELALKPKSASFIESAAVPLAALTAWQALVDAAKIDKGQTVLIHGGSGGVGSFAIQIAKARGAKVIATASTANQDVLKELGADVAVDYTKQKFEDVAQDVDVVLDSVGKDTLQRSYGVVKKGGYLVSIVSSVDQAELDKHGIRGTTVSVTPNSEELTQIAQLIDAKKIKSVISRVLPLDDAAQAQQQAATHHTRGKLVFKVAEEPK